MKQIKNFEVFSESLRYRILDKTNQRVFISNLLDSEQQYDLRKKPNCGGYGRIRHFKLDRESDWIKDPLPISPANKHLKTNYSTEIKAQVFQIGACNFRCWYCFVDNKLISGKQSYGKFKSSDDLIKLYLNQEEPPKVIDLSGGQPDLVPEWTIWMMDSLIRHKIDNQVLLWSDDNLSNDFFWRFLDDKQIDFIKSYKNYARVGCFKGIDNETFSITTRIEGKRFDYQFEHFNRLNGLGIDLYGYITLTAPTNHNFEYVIPKLLDRFQAIHENLPLRIVPLKIESYTPVKSRISKQHLDLLEGQMIAIKVWKKQLKQRFNSRMLEMDISDINI